MVQKLVALAPPSSMLTNIGRIDPIELGTELTVRETGFLLSPPAQYPICVTAASYDGKPLLNLLYDHGKMSHVQAKRIADNLIRQLDSATD